MTLTTLTLQVQEEDIGMFYQLASIYHQDRSHFASVVEKLTRGNDEFVGAQSKAPVGEEPALSKWETVNLKEKNFYEAIISDCECGTCFNTFKRPSRTPWKPLGSGKFINSQYGEVQISGCPVADYNGPAGYVYVSLQVMKEQRNAQIHETKQAIQIESDKIKLSAEKAKLTSVTDKIQKDRNIVSAQNADRHAKLQMQLNTVKQEERQLTDESNQLYKEHKQTIWDACYRDCVDNGTGQLGGVKMITSIAEHYRIDWMDVTYDQCFEYCKLLNKQHLNSTPFKFVKQRQLDDCRNKIKSLTTQMYQLAPKNNHKGEQKQAGKTLPKSTAKTLKGKSRK